MEWVVDTVNYRVQDLGYSKDVSGIINEQFTKLSKREKGKRKPREPMKP